MLETVREFAAEQLRELPEQEQVRAAHASVFWDLAKDLARPPSCPDRAGLDLLELEHDNFRAALDWYGETDPAMALRLANRLTGFWSVRGHFSEGRRRLGELLELVPDDDPERVDALNGAAWLATDQGDRASAIGLLDESIARARAAHDPVREAAGLYYRGRARLVIGDPTGGRADIERALELADRGRRRRRPRGGPVVGAGRRRTSRTSSGSPSNGSNAACSCPRRSACPPSRPGPSSCSACPASSSVTCKAPRRRSRRVCPPIADIGDRFAIPVGLSALAGLAAKEGRPRAALMLAGAAAAYEEVNQTHRPQKIRAELDAWLAPVRKKVGRRGAEAVGRGPRADARRGDRSLASTRQPEDAWRVGVRRRLSPAASRRSRRWWPAA